MHLRFFRIVSPLILFSFAMVVCCETADAQGSTDQVTAKQKQELKKIKTLIDRAAKQFQAKRYDEATENVTEARTKLETLVKEPSAELIQLVTPEYERLKQAVQLLNEQGQSLSALADLPEPPKDMKALSFVSDVAPILATKCGRCHIDRTSGRFSMATFQAIAEGNGVVPDKPEASRLIEVIESGEMPQGGLKIESGELETLKAWISSGAKFDGEDPAANLRSFAMTNNPDRPAIEVSLPTGKETVSFALEIAPVLIANCSGCHIDAQNVRGGLNMTNFRALLAGGDNGAALKPGDGENSLLVQKLKGMGGGQRMPLNRPSLSKEIIAKLTKWIDEGAKFDGRDPRLNVNQVAALAKAESMTHAELTVDRIKNSLDNWQLVMSDFEPQRVESENFFSIGSVDSARLDEFKQLSESLVDDIKSELGIDKKLPLIKGRMTLFVFQKRYDYSEFGKMVESRELPAHFKSHWGYDTINAYAAILTNPREEFDEETIRGKLAQQIAATAMRDRAVDVPKWFADGFGYNVAFELFRKDDLVKSWESEAEKAVASMTRPDDFVQNRMTEDDAAMVSYLFVGSLMKERGDFKKFLKLLNEGNSFADAFSTVFSAQPAELINAYYGTGNGNNNRRQNRRKKR